jgi:hypothetical protein
VTTLNAAAILQSALICQAEAGFPRANELRRRTLRIIETMSVTARLAGIWLQAATKEGASGDRRLKLASIQQH